MRGWLTLALMFALAGCGAAPSAGGGGGGVAVATSDAPGALFLVGGGDLTELTYKRFVTQAGGPGAQVVVVPFASGPAEGDAVKKALEEQGAVATVVTGASDRRPAELAAIRAAQGVFVPGGLVEKLLTDVQPYMEATRAAWLDGCVVGGSSAGAMAWGDQVIVRGDAGPVRMYGLDESLGGAAIRPGLGLLAGATVDPHFQERARLHRLWLAAGETRTVGLGIDEGTVALVTGAGKLRALGAGTVTVIRPEGGPGAPARLTVLKQGDEVDWRSWAIEAR